MKRGFAARAGVSAVALGVSLSAWSLPAADVGASTTKRAIVLSGDSVGSVHFGEAQRRAERALEKLIGPSEGGTRSENGNCTIDAALFWTNFSAYFLRGRFVGYQTGNDLSHHREATFDGVTGRGLRIGDTLTAARRLYAGHVTTSAENGGVYAIDTAEGTIRGYLSLEVSHPPNRVKIASISAGSVGCPAASPG